LRFFADLDSAIGKAEDWLVDMYCEQFPTTITASNQDDQDMNIDNDNNLSGVGKVSAGFIRCLEYIDQQVMRKKDGLRNRLYNPLTNSFSITCASLFSTIAWNMCKRRFARTRTTYGIGYT